MNTTPDIPVVQKLPSGREVVVGISSTMEGAEHILSCFHRRHPHRYYYIDCARTAAEVKAETPEKGR